MHKIISRFAFSAYFITVSLFLGLGATCRVVAQSTTDGQTPLGLKPGSPSGSYPLSDFETVNLYNGNLSFSMPLLTIGGRGGTTFPLTLNIDQKWTISKEVNPGHAAYHFGHSTWWSEDDGGNHTITAGRVRIRRGILKDSFGWHKTLDRITFIAPDGTEYELRDQLTGGQPQTPGGAPFNRGKVFITADGTAATFISDFDVLDAFYPADEEAEYPASGYLMLRDGTKFRIDEDKISWMRDRNGNKVSFTYDFYKRVTSVTDSLNRQITITYDNVSGSETYDQIVYKGFGGASRTVKVGHVGAGSVIRSDITPSYPLFPGLTGVDNSNPPVVNYIELPDGRRYQLQYNGFAEIARVILPTGGAIEYDWANGLTDGATCGLVQAAAPNEWYVYRRVIERRVYPDGGTGASYASRMTYSRPETTTTNLGYVVVDQYNSSATQLAHSIHYFNGSPRASFEQKATDYAAWQDGKEYKSETYTANGSALLRTIDNTFEQRAAVSWWTGSSSTAPPNDVRPTESKSTLNDTNQVSKQTFGYDDSAPFNNQNNVKEYDYGSGTFGSLVRETRTTFLTSSTYTDGTSSSSIHIRNLPLQVSVYNGSNVEKARTTFEYDNYALDGSDCAHSFHCGLTTRSNVSGFDTSFGTGYTTRGNRTAKTQSLIVNGSVTGSISSYAQYDVLGNVLRSIDPRSTLSNIIATSLNYTDCFGAPDGDAQTPTTPTELSGLSAFAYPTTITNAAGHTTYTQLDYYIGKPVDGKDANGIVASGYYNDALDRPTQIRRAVGTSNPSLENQTTFSYDDTNRVITTTSDRDANNDNILKTQLLYDMMGRTIETRQYEGGSNYIAVQTQYDVLGRAYKTSNPFRPWQSETANWTTQGFDDLGRVNSVMTPDNAVVSTTYLGNAVTVTDQAGKKRKSVTDALGRMVQVYEDPTVLNYLTSYSYDALDNLTTVTQGSQTRTFFYDSLKRLASATNPESGTVSYQYDNAGNLTQKTDARGVVSTYVYDVLSRNTSITYTNDPSGTLPVTRVYDTATKGIGRLYQSQTTGTGGSLTTIDSYDALGRPLTQRQQFYVSGNWSSSYTTSRNYNLAGGVTTQTFPSLHSVTYNYDAAGRLADKDAQHVAFSGNLGDGTSRTYAGGITYSSFGGVSTEQFGTTPTPLYHKSFYNIRGQFFDTRLSSVNDTWDWNRGRLILYYSSNHVWGQSGTDNNGNVTFSENWIPPVNASLDQVDTLIEDRYNYDALNRLTSVAEQKTDQAGGWGVWQQQFAQAYSYPDQYGNRIINAAQTWGTGINNKVFSVDTSTNRLGVPNGQSGTMTYDSAGNLTNDTYSGYGQCTYDAENRMVSAQDNYAGWSYYTYNADGQRVRRKINNVETWAIYGMDGEMLAEYPMSGATTSPQKEYGYRNGQLLITAEAASTFNGYLNRRTITLDHTKVPNTDQSNFPILVKGTYSYLATVANGGNVQNTNGYDVIFTSDSGCATKLNHEVETYSASTGAVNYWVKVPSVSHTTDTVIYICYGNSTITTDQSSKTAVWDTNYKGVWHLSDNAANNTVTDSTGANNGTNQANTSSKTSTGQIGTALTYNGSSDYTDLGTNVGNYTLSNSFTLEAWINPALDSVDRAIFGNAWAAAGYLLRVNTANKGRFILVTNGSNYNGRDSSTLSAGWHHVVGVWSGSGTPNVYIDGVLNNAATITGGSVTTITTSAHTRIGATPENGNQCYFNGTIDEVRTSNTARSADWITTEYNNQNSPSTFYSISSATSGSSANVHWLVADQLGTPRMIVDQTGTLANLKRHDYLPFGEEVYGGTDANPGLGGRRPGLGYGCDPSNQNCLPDGVRQQFTAKERDNETGLDYFGARYYGNNQGRFTSPDPLLSSGRSLQPQSWNRYSYVINRPLSLVDPKGLDWGVTEWDDKKGHHTNYHWFDGKIGQGPDGRSYTAVNFGKSGSLDVPTDNGQTVRISNLGIIRRVIYSGPAGGGPSNGQGNPLNMSAGLVDGAIPFGKQIREAAFGKMGVDTSAPEYENASTISGGVTTGALLLTGVGEAELAEEGTTTLYRAVSNAEFEQIMETGTFEAGANSLGGKWFAETAEHANQWGEILEGKGAFKVVDAKIPTVQAEKFMRLERLDGIGPARYAELKQLTNVVIGKGP